MKILVKNENLGKKWFWQKMETKIFLKNFFWSKTISLSTKFVQILPKLSFWIIDELLNKFAFLTKQFYQNFAKYKKCPRCLPYPVSGGQIKSSVYFWCHNVSLFFAFRYRFAIIKNPKLTFISTNNIWKWLFVIVKTFKSTALKIIFLIK